MHYCSRQTRCVLRRGSFPPRDAKLSPIPGRLSHFVQYLQAPGTEAYTPVCLRSRLCPPASVKLALKATERLLR